MQAYTVQEAADLLGISERAVRRRITQGTLHALRGGNRWLVILSDAEQHELGNQHAESHAGTTNLASTGNVSPELQVERRFPPASMDQQASQLRMLLGPFIEELGETKRQNGWLLRENQRLAQRVRQLESQLAAGSEGDKRRRHRL